MYGVFVVGIGVVGIYECRVEDLDRGVEVGVVVVYFDVELILFYLYCLDW